jgi:hypothetical protein
MSNRTHTKVSRVKLAVDQFVKDLIIEEGKAHKQAMIDMGKAQDGLDGLNDMDNLVDDFMYETSCNLDYAQEMASNVRDYDNQY